MYGGDEVAGIVIDIGSSTIKAGFAGEDSPKAVFPSCIGVLNHKKRKTGQVTDMEVETDTGAVASQAATSGTDVAAGSGAKTANNNNNNIAAAAAAAASEDGEKDSFSYYVGPNSLLFRRDFMEIENTLTDGIVSNWDHLERLLDHTFKERLRVSPTDHPILVSEPMHNPKGHRERIVKLLFEKFHCPAVFVAKNPVLAAFSAGKATALVVDSGSSGSSVVPVVDGYALAKSAVRNSFGGDEISRRVLDFLENTKHVNVKSNYMFSRKKFSEGQFQVTELAFPNTTQSYRDWSVMNVVNDVKRSIFRVSETAFDVKKNVNIPSAMLELPDGTEVQVGAERFGIPEVLFKEDMLDQNRQPVALQLMAYDAIMKCDSDIRKDLYATTILTGGNTLFPGLPKRFESEIVAKAPSNIRVKTPIAATTTSERLFGNWIGGSILASLGTFQQMWISRQEFDESGQGIVHKKCP